MLPEGRLHQYKICLERKLPQTRSGLLSIQISVVNTYWEKLSMFLGRGPGTYCMQSRSSTNELQPFTIKYHIQPKRTKPTINHRIVTFTNWAVLIHLRMNSPNKPCWSRCIFTVCQKQSKGRSRCTSFRIHIRKKHTLCLNWRTRSRGDRPKSRDSKTISTP